MSFLRYLLCLVCLLALFQPGLGGEVVFFEGDHYKAVGGSPKLVASVANPQIDQGRSILRIALANIGALEELIPVGKGNEPNVSEEISEEGHDVDAAHATVVLSGSGPVTVRPRPVHIDSLHLDP